MKNIKIPEGYKKSGIFMRLSKNRKDKNIKKSIKFKIRKRVATAFCRSVLDIIKKKKAKKKINE